MPSFSGRGAHPEDARYVDRERVALRLRSSGALLRSSKRVSERPRPRTQLRGRRRARVSDADRLPLSVRPRAHAPLPPPQQAQRFLSARLNRHKGRARPPPPTQAKQAQARRPCAVGGLWSGACQCPQSGTPLSPSCSYAGARRCVAGVRPRGAPHRRAGACLRGCGGAAGGGSRPECSWHRRPRRCAAAPWRLQSATAPQQARAAALQQAPRGIGHARYAVAPLALGFAARLTRAPLPRAHAACAWLPRWTTRPAAARLPRPAKTCSSTPWLARAAPATTCASQLRALCRAEAAADAPRAAAAGPAS